MALDLQIQTAEAQANIEAATASIRDFITVTQSLGRASGQIDSFVQSLNNVRPVSPEVAASINQTADAALRLGSAATSVEGFAASLNGLSGGGAATAATSIREVSAAASTIQPIGALDQISAGMSNAGRAAQSLVNPMTAAMSSSVQTANAMDQVAAGMNAAGLASATTSARLGPMIQGMTQSGQAAAAAGSNLYNMGQGLSEAGEQAEAAGTRFNQFSQILLAIGFSYVIGGIRDLVSESLDASSALTSLEIRLDNISGTAGSGAKAFSDLAQTAYQLGLPLDVLTHNFGNFELAVTSSGKTVAEAQTIYTNFAKGFASLGLQGQSVQRAFYAVDEVFERGNASAQQLFRQLAQAGVPMSALAKSMGLVDSNGNGMISSLRKASEAGQVTSAVFIKFAQDLATQYAPSLAAASATGAAAFERLSTGFLLLKQTIGGNIFAVITPEVNSFAAAMVISDGPLQKLATTFGEIAGGVGAAALWIIQALATGLSTFATVLQMVGGWISKGISGLNDFSIAMYGVPLSVVLPPLEAFFNLFGPAVVTIIGVAVAVSTLGKAMSIASAAAAFFSAEWVGIAITLAAAVAGLIVIGAAVYSLYQTLSNGSSFTQNFSNNIDKLGGVVTDATNKIYDIVGSIDANKTATDDASNSTDRWAKLYGVLYNNAAETTPAVEKTATAAGHVAASADSAGKAVTSFGDKLNGSANSADHAAASYNNAAGAASRYNAAVAGGQGAGGGGSFGSFETNDDFSVPDGSNWNPPKSSGASSGSSSSGSRSSSDLVSHGLSDNWGGVLGSGGAAQTVGGGVSDGFSDSWGGALGNGDWGDAGLGDSGGSTVSFRYGGIVGSNKYAAGGRQSVPASAFVDAPHFADGGLTGAGSTGIPSILHPNEAVIPLAGGAVPVQLNGGQTNDNSGSASNPITSLLTQITQDDVTRDDLIGKSNDKLDLILGQLTSEFPKLDTFTANAMNLWTSLLTAVGAVTTAIGQVSSSGGGSSGGSSSSGSISGSSSTGDQPLSAADAFKATQTQISSNAAGKNNSFLNSFNTLQQQVGAASLTTGQPLWNPDYLMAQYNDSSTAASNNAIDLQNQQLIEQYDAQYGKGAYEKLQSKEHFASGSPNAWQDASGGFQATLHPDEAVIPLPDGRSVPVNIPSLDAVTEMLKEWTTRPAQTLAPATGTHGAANNTQNVQFVISTPDANSFRKSQPQIIASLRGQLQRASQTSGAIKRQTEDPTKRYEKLG